MRVSRRQRPSVQGQQVDLQVDALQKAGCELIFQEIVSGAKADRPELAKMRAQLRKGDTVCIYKLEGTGPPAVGPVHEASIGTGR